MLNYGKLVQEKAEANLAVGPSPLRGNRKLRERKN
ncbi:hypothetical protein Golax_024319 [Gossypium laxum]|uniref:Uncharacterized protein n=1 Tax=Gossypium laxum TaxID=34288 RepID=A0A7J8ZDE1_9ROSI|nr:hypothetical protein [Gossypium laxum]